MINMPKITDSHCHLDFPDFNDDLSEVINNALKMECVEWLPFVQD